jgi:hypothetical protein
MTENLWIGLTRRFHDGNVKGAIFIVWEISVLCLGVMLEVQYLFDEDISVIYWRCYVRDEIFVLWGYHCKVWALCQRFNMMWISVLYWRYARGAISNLWGISVLYKGIGHYIRGAIFNLWGYQCYVRALGIISEVQ